jgi:hypothetical protein
MVALATWGALAPLIMLTYVASADGHTRGYKVSYIKDACASFLENNSLTL